MKSFIEKNKPKNSNDIPQDNINLLKDLILKKKHILLVGPVGSCKTSAIYTIAEELDYEVLELNASDVRNKGNVEKIIGEACKQISLFGKKRLILIDEAEELSGIYDRGGSSAIYSIIQESKTSIVMTANDIGSDKLKELKKLSETIIFDKINTKKICDILKNICIKENVISDDNDLRKMAIQCNGDLRAALNDLQCCIIGKKLELEGLGFRDYETDINNSLRCILKTKTINAIRYIDSLDMNPDEYFLWIDENIPHEYIKSEDIFSSYERLAKSNIFTSRIRRQQYWRFLYYSLFFATSGVSLAKEKPYTEVIKYKRSIRPLRIWQSNMKNQKKKDIALKISKLTHTSFKGVIKNFNYYKNFISLNSISNELKLNEDELNYLKRY